MLRRTAQVLRLTLRPLNPGSTFMAVIQLVIWLGVPLLPFAYKPAHWTWARAVFVAVVVLALLSLRVSYDLLADNETFLIDTPLMKVLAERTRSGNELRARLRRRRRGGDLPRPLAHEVIAWGQETLRETETLAGDISDDLFYAHAYAPQTLRRSDHLRYLDKMVRRLGRLGRDLGKSK